jgi:hypothetical protein
MSPDEVYEAWLAEQAEREAVETLRATQMPYPIHEDPAWAPSAIEVASWD